MKRSIVCLFVGVALFLVVFVSLTVVAFGQTQEKEQDDARSLARACSLTLDVNAYHPRKVQGEREAFDLGFCLGLYKAAFMSGSGRDFCPAREVSLREGLELTVKFVSDYPDLEKKDAADIVRWTLSEKFPC